jgi:hypothetical protein
MVGGGVDVPGVGLLDDAPAVHDRDPVGELDEQRDVVGDEEDGEAQLAARESWRRICRRITTSSAVVGSSRMTTSGSRARAIAIMTRWRMPPGSWCG